MRSSKLTSPFVTFSDSRAAQKQGNRSCGSQWQSSYSRHDTQKRGVAGADRDDIDDGSFSVDVRPHLPQCRAGLGSCGDAALVIYLCVWLLQRGSVLLRVPSGAAVVMILAMTAFLGMIVREGILRDLAAWEGAWVGAGVSQALAGFGATLVSAPYQY